MGELLPSVRSNVRHLKSSNPWPPGGPIVVIAGMAAHEHHVIDAGRPAQHLAAGDRHGPVLEPLTTFSRIAPVHPIGFRIELQSGASHGHGFMLWGFATCFEQSNRYGWIFAEPRSQ